jgi:hypothetical protein
MKKIEPCLVLMCLLASSCTGASASEHKAICAEDVKYFGYCELANYRKDCLCIIRSSLQSGLTVSTLTIAESEKEGPQQKLEYSTPNSIRLVYPMEGDRIVTVWETGNSVNVIVFAAVGDSIKQVFERGSENQPEFADVNDDGKLEVLFSTGRSMASHGKAIRTPSQAEIYQWTGTEYRLLRTATWKERFSSR